MPSVGYDKLLHFAFSYAIARVSPAMAVFAGVFKEWWDAVSGAGASWRDLVADWLGIAWAVMGGTG